MFSYNDLLKYIVKKIAIILILTITLAACVPAGVGKTVKFEEPDIKDEFCGGHINFQFCKCAFHNEYCDAVGMNKSSANTHIQAEYEKWVSGLRSTFADNCQMAGGIFKADECQYCEDGYVSDGRVCVEADSVKSTFQADGPLTNECEIIQDQFDRDWKKYSDIDNAIPFAERSFEAKQALTSYDAMIDLMIEGFQLERDYEIEQQMMVELEAYRTALVQDLKTNLLKSFWRLSWVTYSTIKGGKGLGESYTNLLTSAEGIEAIGTGLKVVQGVIPSDSQLAIDTSTLGGKAKSVGASVALEAIESLGDPVKIATTLFDGASNAALPSADLTPEEIDVLKEQHLSKGVIDQVLAESRSDNEARQERMAGIEDDIAELQTEVDSFEAQEKERVKVSLEESCKELKKQFEDKN